MAFDREQFAKDGDEAGVFIDCLGRALVTWTAMQDHSTTVSEAAKVFNTSVEVIREAVENATWIDIDGAEGDPDKQYLELDGC